MNQTSQKQASYHFINSLQTITKIVLSFINLAYATTCRALFLILSIVCSIAFLVLASNILIKL